MRAPVGLVGCVLVLATTPFASAGVIGATPQGAALAATKRHAQLQVRAWNRPGVWYTLGACRLVHRRPWLAYGCEWELHGEPPPHCLDRLILAVRRLGPEAYRAVAVKDTQVVEDC